MLLLLGAVELARICPYMCCNTSKLFVQHLNDLELFLACLVSNLLSSVLCDKVWQGLEVRIKLVLPFYLVNTQRVAAVDSLVIKIMVFTHLKFWNL